MPIQIEDKQAVEAAHAAATASCPKKNRVVVVVVVFFGLKDEFPTPIYVFYHIFFTYQFVRMNMLGKFVFLISCEDG